MQRLRKTREHETALAREKTTYETAIRERYRKSAEQEAELVLEQKRKLDQYSQDLHTSFRAMVSEYQAQVCRHLTTQENIYVHYKARLTLIIVGSRS